MHALHAWRIRPWILRPLFSKMTFLGLIKSLEMAFERKKSVKTYNLNLPKIGGI